MGDEWRTWALCSLMELDTATFYPDTHYPERVEFAKQVCSQCEVRQSCLDYALENLETDGIFGGLTYEERKSYRLERYLAERRVEILQRNKQREQLHLVDASPSSQEHNVDLPKHNQLVLLTLAVERISFDGERLVYERFLSSLDLPLHYNQKPLYEHPPVLSTMLRKLQDRISQSNGQDQEVYQIVIPVLQAIEACFSQLLQQEQPQSSSQDLCLAAAS